MRTARTSIALIAGLVLALGCAVARAPEARPSEVLVKATRVDHAGGDPCPAHRQRSTFCRMFRPFSA
ncbi:hypothetical protein L2Y94_17925 [Luteibacter aegosomatis]|uniref:hypothetical protein n=1 Tax=Luteibacter aegosomatis TaxID=2911537 RepID=UPI001FF90DF5|nr:hypothetical protein [Luteibacter aegosomatis]UPG85166.1 hypothetical protein L2Y94_17925 [Luteibacter aegosomatis]